MSHHKREDDMLFDLFRAIYADDLGSAKDVPALMHNTAGDDRAELIRRARQTVTPLPKSDPVTAIPLPQPGEHPHQVFGPGYSNPRNSAAEHPLRKRKAAR